MVKPRETLPAAIWYAWLGGRVGGCKITSTGIHAGARVGDVLVGVVFQKLTDHSLILAFLGPLCLWNFHLALRCFKVPCLSLEVWQRQQEAERLTVSCGRHSLLGHTGQLVSRKESLLATPQLRRTASCLGVNGNFLQVTRQFQGKEA